MGSEPVGTCCLFLHKGLNKPLQTGCPQQVPETHGPSSKQVQQHLSSHPRAKPTLSHQGAKECQKAQGWSPAFRGNTGSPVGVQPHPISPVCTGERLASRSRQGSVRGVQLLPSRFKSAHLAALSWLQLQPHWAGVSLLSIDLWKTQGCLKSIQILLREAMAL